MKTRILILSIVLVIIIASTIGVYIFANQRISTDVIVYYENENIYEDSPYTAIITQKRVMVPLQHTFDYFGWEEGTVMLSQDGQSVHFQGGDSGCDFVLNEKTATRFWSDSSQETIYMDVAPIKIDGVFYIPLRAYCEIWNKKISWDKSNKAVYIEKNLENKELEREYEYKKETVTYAEPVSDSNEKDDYILGPYMHPKYPENYSVKVFSIEDGKINFEVMAIKAHGSAISRINITEDFIDNECHFSFVDDFQNAGTGVLRINGELLTVEFDVPEYAGRWCVDASEGTYVNQKPKPKN